MQVGSESQSRLCFLEKIIMKAIIKNSKKSCKEQKNVL